jgi:hypothetical protein
MPFQCDNSSPVSHKQVIEAYFQAIRLIDERVTPLLGRVTTRVLVQAAAKRLTDAYPFLSVFARTPYTDINQHIISEQLSGVPAQELATGLDALLDACFHGLKELTGDIIAPPLYTEVTQQLHRSQ